MGSIESKIKKLNLISNHKPEAFPTDKAMDESVDPATETPQVVEVNPNGSTVVFPINTAVVPTTHKSVFLAGAIDQGTAVDWQEHFIKSLEGLPVVIFNPRRKQWNSKWPQTIEFGPFKDQVNWELNSMDHVDFIPMYFPHAAQAPISLLELGLYSKSGKLLVGCPKDYHRRGNVEIVCHRLGIPFFETLEDLEAEVKTRILALKT